MAQAEIYAVCGDPILHSLSPEIFNAAFASAGLESAYTRVAAGSAEEALELARAIGVRGLNVTSPFKESMAELMDETDEVASAMGAVNTVRITERGVHGYNTDATGVATLLERGHVDPRGKHFVILGAGGAARSAAYALKNLEAEVTVVNRTRSRGERMAESLGVGFAPLEEAGKHLAKAFAAFACLPQGVGFEDEKALGRVKFIIDANYHGSPFADFARKHGIRYADGREWLLGQARASFRIFTGMEPSADAMRRAVELGAAKNRDTRFLVLTGMMGTGKSAVARALAEPLGMEAIDTDSMVEAEAGKPIPRIFEEDGECQFRELEARAVDASFTKPRRVIALGGGALTNEDLARLVRSKGTVVWLWASPPTCADRAGDGTRPLLEGKDAGEEAARILSERRMSYARASDMVISTEGHGPDETAGKIADEMRKSRRG